MICIDHKCPRREDCASAKPHEETLHCKEGCSLLDEKFSRKPCVRVK